MINKFDLLCVIFSGSPDLTLRTCLVQMSQTPKDKMCVLSFSTTLPGMFFILRRNEGNTIKMYVGLHVQYPLFLSVLMKLELSR